jgi:hypothetical protein
MNTISTNDPYVDGKCFWCEVPINARHKEGCRVIQSGPVLVQSVDMINHPPHYADKGAGVECIDVVELFNFNMGNAIKYIWRADDKGDPIENLRKAEWYVKREIERRTKNGI